MIEPIELNSKNVYEVVAQCLKKIEELPKINPISEEYAKLLNWPDEMIVWGKLNGYII